MARLPTTVLRAVPIALTAATVGAQISYPLTTGPALTSLTIAVVVLFAGASLSHAAVTLGLRRAAVILAVAVGCGLTAEIIGVATGFPFGRYEYTPQLGWSIAGVPVVIGLAWAILAWPALLVGRRLAPGTGPRRRLGVAVLGGATLASWDLFLDPQMTTAGHWAFSDPTPGLPKVADIPLTNYGGWLLVSLVVVALLDRVVTNDPVTDQGVPAILLGWTWLGSTLANAAFFDQPWVALYGGVGMGLFVGPYLVSLARGGLHPRLRPTPMSQAQDPARVGAG